MVYTNGYTAIDIEANTYSVYVGACVYIVDNNGGTTIYKGMKDDVVQL